jgi:FlaG/FlaF family flagellin (archaellin)
MSSGNIRSADDAVSSVISVILMVGVVVILGAVVSVFALGFGESLDSTGPPASFEFKVLDTGDIEVTHTSGATLNGDQLRFAGAAHEKTSFGGITEWSGEITAGDSATVNVKGGKTLRLIWQSPEADKTATLSEYNVPDDVDPTASIGSIEAKADESTAEVKNITFSRVSDGTVTVVVEKHIGNRATPDTDSLEISTNGGDFTATKLSPTQPRRGSTTITVWVYETNDKSIEITNRTVPVNGGGGGGVVRP